MRYTTYDNELGRWVVRCLYGTDEDWFMVKTGAVTTTQGVIINKDPDVVFGKIIDHLAELETADALNVDKILGYDLDHLRMVAELIKKHGVTPEDLHDLKGNFQHAFALLQEEVRRTTRAAIERATQAPQPITFRMDLKPKRRGEQP